MSLDEKGEPNTDVGGPELEKVYWEKDLKQSIKELKEKLKDYPDGEFPEKSVWEIIDEVFGKGLI